MSRGTRLWGSGSVGREMVQAGKLFWQRREWLSGPGDMVRIRWMNGVMRVWRMGWLWFVRVRVGVSG